MEVTDNSSQVPGVPLDLKEASKNPLGEARPGSVSCSVIRSLLILIPFSVERCTHSPDWF